MGVIFFFIFLLKSFPLKHILQYKPIIDFFVKLGKHGLLMPLLLNSKVVIIDTT